MKLQRNIPENNIPLLILCFQMKETIANKFVSILFPSSRLGEHDSRCFGSFAIYFSSLNKRGSLRGGSEVGGKEKQAQNYGKRKRKGVPAELRAPWLQPDCGAGGFLQLCCQWLLLEVSQERATQSTILAWEIPWTEEPAGYHPGGQAFSLSCDQQLTWIWPILWERSLARSVERAMVMEVGAAWLSMQGQSDRKPTEGLRFFLVQAPHPVYCITQTFI